MERCVDTITLVWCKWVSWVWVWVVFPLHSSTNLTAFSLDDVCRVESDWIVVLCEIPGFWWLKLYSHTQNTHQHPTTYNMQQLFFKMHNLNSFLLHICSMQHFLMFTHLAARCFTIYLRLRFASVERDVEKNMWKKVKRRRSRRRMKRALAGPDCWQRKKM
jgi:hypothetical protein